MTPKCQGANFPPKPQIRGILIDKWGDLSHMTSPPQKNILRIWNFRIWKHSPVPLHLLPAHIPSSHQSLDFFSQIVMVLSKICLCFQSWTSSPLQWIFKYFFWLLSPGVSIYALLDCICAVARAQKKTEMACVLVGEGSESSIWARREDCPREGEAELHCLIKGKGLQFTPSIDPLSL